MSQHSSVHFKNESTLLLVFDSTNDGTAGCVNMAKNYLCNFFLCSTRIICYLIVLVLCSHSKADFI